uniref:Myosin heavy chain family protein n=1 Tax=Rhizophora mucronata TaxID=61149 RepID=A0A2P2QNG5_RHIMU
MQANKIGVKENRLTSNIIALATPYYGPNREGGRRRASLS